MLIILKERRVLGCCVCVHWIAVDVLFINVCHMAGSSKLGQVTYIHCRVNRAAISNDL